ncbi:MAG TPA: 2-dehydropantoate 2-reductase [Thermohalobaculum sp.]|nr:2-dehydropantoate 2-reductase [Thermohalobaculum sp.]
MRYSVIGTGGIGGYLAARLIKAGHEVAVLARGAHLAAIRANGLTMRHQGEEVQARPAVATDKGAELGVADVAIFAVKGQDLSAAIEAARPAVGPKTQVLPFLNGVEAPGILADAFGAERALIGVAHISSFIAEPGVIATAMPLADFLIGNLEGSQEDPRVAAIIAEFRAAGISTPDRQDLRVDLWSKLVFLASLAGTTAGGRCDMATVRATPQLWALFRTLAEEVHAVGVARGVALPSGSVDATMRHAEKVPGAVRASMAHDLAAGKRLELDWLNGAVVRLGAEVGVDVPAHATVTALLAPWRDGGGR